MDIKKVTTKRKGLVDLNELNAIQVAYGKPINHKDYLNYVGIPAFFLALFSFLLLFYWWVSLGFAVLGAVYGLKVIMPKSIKRAYEMASLNERNSFINSMTQILTDKNKTVSKALEIVASRLSGELKEDVEVLLARTTGADRFQVSKAFSMISKKYEKDVVFCQYLEQLETSIYEGRENVDTFKQIKTHHKDVLLKTNKFLSIKNGHLMNMKIMLSAIFLFIIMAIFSNTPEQYYNQYSRHIIGWITSGVYMAVISTLISGFFKKYFDDEIMSL
ncbi:MULTISPECIES: hypothetical protein [Vagococcus]|uniref:Flp pilus assembly protein TadB n=1 Tax=Vagococcus fluvialis bH819 TaxID=1255619 RepID=A0A1X6WS62_9ENTE|nr:MULTISPECIES: hypothetical protein [Vagococcus]SLM87089.1 hypothetical protein FM121_13405 [Vagococcus fluvialis bH819]HCM90563.1 hypothetical protein [Vagococcus sp.]